MENNRIYVCEWVKKDISFLENDEFFSILQNYDYTYHTSLEQAKEISSMGWRGYAWAKGHIYNSDEPIQEKPLHKKVHCECIWI